MKESTLACLERMLAPALQTEKCRNALTGSAGLLIDCYRAGGKVLSCGNGGSAADSEHIVGELMKGFLLSRKIPAEQQKELFHACPRDAEALIEGLQGALPAISLVSHSALITAFSNDVDPAMVFAQQVFGYGKPGDVLIAISTSGNSKNVVNAARVARAFGLKTVGLTGERGGMLRELCDVTFCAPSADTYRIQEYHINFYHALCAMVEAEFFA